MSPKPSVTHLLLVDDDLILRGMATQTLRHAGFEVTAVDSGEEGLRVFETELIDLVLLDVMMPGLDGFEVCSRLRAMPRGAQVPILMLTGLNDAESVEAAFRCGATDFITKPINWTLLGHRVRYSLRASASAEAAMQSSQHLANAQRLANLGSWEWHIDGDELTCSEELLKILGRPAGGGADLSVHKLLDHVCDADRHAVGQARDAAAGQGQPYQLDFSIVRLDGKPRILSEQASARLDASGRVVAIEAIVQDITARIEAERRIHQLAFYDGLTGLANRQLFMDFARMALERARRLRSLCAVVHIDLDRFKSVNDALGQQGGNAVLRMLAERLQETIRCADMASTHRVDADSESEPEMVARVGGNGFTLLLVDIASNEQAALITNRLLQAVSEPLHLYNEALVLTASAGISLFPRDASDASGLAEKAEQAMYAAKAAGRARVRFYDNQMNAAASVRLMQENDLRRGIDEGEMCLFYQPQVNAATGEMTGAEALIRWRHPRRGLVSPADFIALAEETGLIKPLGEWVIRAVCEAISRWQANGLSQIPVSINLSIANLVDSDLVENLEMALHKFGINAKRLTLEITESMLMSDPDRTVARLHLLREKGFGLSLDDFGTGFSSLSYLKRFPVHELKIDRSFVRDATRGGLDAAIAGSIIELGKQFGLHVVAEGVETAEEAAFLVARGCTAHQGYFYARPMPVEDFEDFLARQLTFPLEAPKR
jgi:diguanylate cyclase (GGDEF)-like protein/PAS domain S-box-containing protein